MASVCPKCHQELEEDFICCAEVAYTWKCTECRKLSKGLVIPFGRCQLCGGRLEVVEPYAFEDPARLQPIQQALQAELNATTFYAAAAAEADDPEIQTLFAGLSEMEREHLRSLAEKYHAHLTTDQAPAPDPVYRQVFLENLGVVPSEERPLALIACAIDMERRARAFFLQQVEVLPEGPEREIYRELAAEEDEHIALLESGLARTRPSHGSR